MPATKRRKPTKYRPDELFRYVACGEHPDMPGELIIGRREDGMVCSQCEREHPYALVFMFPENPGENWHMFDSWDDAAAWVSERLPDRHDFRGWREPLDNPDPFLHMRPLADRREAAAWLLSHDEDEGTP